jgi:hypothetical protein
MDSTTEAKMTKIRISENVVYRSFGSETVLLNLKTGQYHGLKGAGGRMLQVLAERGDLDEAAAQVAREYDHPVEIVTKDLSELCDALAERSLVEIDKAAEQA